MNLPRLTLAVVLLSSLLSVARAEDAYTQSVDAWRADRTARLTKPDGWLSLIGLHWLQPGDNTVGRGPENKIQLSAGPDFFGTVNLGPGGVVTFKPNPSAYALIDDQPAHATELRYRDGTKPSVVRSGTVSFFVIERGDRRVDLPKSAQMATALRVRDTESPRRKNFPGLDWFAVDPAWRIEATWVPFAEPRETKITNVLGQLLVVKVPGKAVFTHDGHTYELLPIDEGPGEPLFFVFTDATAGDETYESSRFLYADAPKDGKVILDFNEAQNPPCAFTPFATCPLPPKENRLPFKVLAGEKKFKGEHR
ncbi:MAG: DUF1684 domain-containing protein [Opitutae bacterium]|nr:DUF1684 domain-containing protein [Opitutae bacterium]